MFKKLLFATTASPVCDNAAKVAFDLEMKWEAKLLILHVLGVPGRSFSLQFTDVRTGEREEISQDYNEWVKEEMNNTYGKLLEDSNASIVTAIGDPYREILRLARKEDADMIIMGAHSREEDVGATKHRSVAGSTMRKVAKAARCAVVVVNRPCTTCWRLFSNIVVGTDFSKASFSAFLWAFKLAREVGANLHIFHAIDITAEGLTLPAGQTTIEQRVKEARRRIEQTYIPKLQGYDKYSMEVWEGIPYVEILKFARERQADLIVMAHHTREIDPEEAERPLIFPIEVGIEDQFRRGAAEKPAIRLDLVLELSWRPPGIAERQQSIFRSVADGDRLQDLLGFPVRERRVFLLRHRLVHDAVCVGRQRVVGRGVEHGHLRTERLGERDRVRDGLLGELRSVGGDEDVLVHAFSFSWEFLRNSSYATRHRAR